MERAYPLGFCGCSKPPCVWSIVIDFGHVWGNMRNSTDIVSTQMGKTGASWSPTIGGRDRIWYDRSPFIVEELYLVQCTITWIWYRCCAYARDVSIFGVIH